MTGAALDWALRYATRGWPVFPCRSRGERRKQPLLQHGLHDASADPALIRKWWARWPDALIGLPTGMPIGAVVLDVDVKRPEANGYDTLADLGFAVLSNTPMAHTASSGLHLYFAVPNGGLRNTGGDRGRGIGPGLDWRGDGGYVIAPSPGSGYSWDPHWNFQTVAPAPIPTALLPREPDRIASVAAVRPAVGLSPYATAALDNACRRIIAAPDGQQEETLHVECFGIGTLAGAEAIPADFARRTLQWAARQLRSHDPHRPWRVHEIELKVMRSFERGVQTPREARRA